MAETMQLTKSIDASNLEAWLIVRTDPAKSLTLAEKTLTESEKLNYKKGIAWSYGNIGAAHTWLGNYEKALEFSFKGVDLLHETDELKQEVQILYNLSIVFHFLGDPDKQLHYAFESLHLARKIGDRSGEANGLNGVGTVHYYIGKNEEAIKYLSEGCEIALEIGDKNVLGKIYDGLGQSYFHLENYQKALEFKNKSLEVVNELGVKQIQSYAHDGLGEIYTKLEDYTKALDHFQKSLELRTDMGFRKGIGDTNLHIADTYAVAGDNLASLKYYKETLKIADELNLNELRFKAHLGLSNLYEKMGNLALFVEHFKAYHEARQKHASEVENKKIRAFELKGKLEQIQKEKELLEAKNEELQSYFEDVKTLSKIGNELTSTLDLEGIITIVYERINTLMHTSGVFVALCNESRKTLEVKLAIKDGKRDNYFEYDLNDANRLPVLVATKALEIHINDYDSEFSKYLSEKEVFFQAAMSSVVVLPLMAKEKVIGVLYVESDKKAAYSQHHFNLLKSFASYIAIAIENARLYENMEEIVHQRTTALEQSYKNTETLNRIGQELISTLNFENVFERLYRNVNELMDATIFGVRLVNAEKNTVDYLYEYERGERLEELSVSMDNQDNYSVWCIKNNQEVLIHDNEVDYKKYVSKVMVVGGDFPYSLIFYPLRKGDRVLGAISVQSFSKNAYSDYHVNIVKTLAHYTVIALENSLHFERMEEEVKLRTQEVVKQKEEIEKTYEDAKLLSEIGRQITSQLSIEKINEVVYERIHKLMHAEGFGIGIFEENQNRIYYPGYIESGQILEECYDELDNKNNLASYCFNNEEQIVVGHLQEEYINYISTYNKPQAGEEVTSLIYLPLMAKDKKIGVITVQSFERNAYTGYHLNILQSIAVYTGIAIDNASLYENMEERVQERTQEIDKAYQNTKLIGQISRDITESLSVEKIISKVYDNINTVMDATCFGIGIYDPATETIKMPGFIENGEKMELFGYSIHDDRLATWCFNNQKEIFISNYFEEYNKYIKGLKKPVSGKDSASIIYLPLWLKDKVVGLITVQSYEPNAYSEYHMDILRGLANTIAAAIENAKLYESLEDKVKERTAEVVKQKEIIEEKNKNITDSIIYAKRIQDATLPAKELVRNYLQDSFVLFKPKDIVSGDFYWIERVDDTILFAVVDCTGHGVPGAFLSLIGHNSLNQIVNELKIYQPNKILEELNRIVSKTLHNNNVGTTSIKDGMDMAICSLNLTSNLLQFAGAFNPLYLVRDNNMEEIKGDKFPIGAGFAQNPEFTNNVIQLKEGDCIYLFSDGYADQFGGPKGKKFKYSRFKEILVEINAKDMSEQHDILNNMIEEWQGDLEQIDDVCVIGIRP